MLTPVDVLEWTGSISGTIGAVLMARNTRLSGMAYPLWILSSVALMLFAIKTGHVAILLQQACFTCINALGLYRWVLKPRWMAARFSAPRSEAVATPRLSSLSVAQSQPAK